MEGKPFSQPDQKRAEKILETADYESPLLAIAVIGPITIGEIRWLGLVTLATWPVDCTSMLTKSGIPVMDDDQCERTVWVEASDDGECIDIGLRVEAAEQAAKGDG